MIASEGNCKKIKGYLLVKNDGGLTVFQSKRAKL